MPELTASQANRLGERLRQGVTPGDLALLRAHRESYRPALEEVVVDVRSVVNAALGTPFVPIATRPAKTTRSIVAKLVRERTRLSRMQDIAGCRVVVALLEDQDTVVGALVEQHPDWRIEDRRADPRHGYRAVHLVTPPPRCVEVQVRTVVQEVWARTSEALDRRFEGLKYGQGHPALVAMLEAWSVRLAELESSGLLSPELVRDGEGLAQLVTSMLEAP